MTFINHFIAVPDIVLTDEYCSSTDKLVLGIINSLSKESNYCFASNQYFSKILGVSIRTIKRSLSNLKKNNYIEVKNINSKRNIIISPYLSTNGDSNGIKYSDNNITKNKHVNKKNNKEPIISKDKDGVELWNGVRCVSTPCEDDSFIEFIKEFRK